MNVPKLVLPSVIGALLLLIAWGAWRDHRLSEARIRWQATTDSLLAVGTIKDSLANHISARADSLERVAQQVVVLRPKNDSILGRMAVEAWQLRAALDSARNAADSLPLARSVILKQDTLISTQAATIQTERAASDGIRQAAGLLRQRITLDSGRIVDLTHQLVTLPKPAWKRLLLGFLPFRAAPCLFGGVTSHGEARIGAGACLTK
jgi:hypothetical protein